MPDIHLDLWIAASAKKIYSHLSTPEGLSSWWPENARWLDDNKSEIEFDFGPGYIWTARVLNNIHNKNIVFKMTQSDEDWNGTLVGFELENEDSDVRVRFSHTGWPELNDHYRRSAFCWAMYLRVLKRHLEYGENVPYSQRGLV